MVLATEAGQAALTTATDLEMALLARCCEEHAMCSVEHALSGPGLMNLYVALCELRGATPSLDTPDAITAAANRATTRWRARAWRCSAACWAARSATWPCCTACTAAFTWPAGSCRRSANSCCSSSFVERFLNKGPMREALERIPVTLVEHGQLGVIGAASWYLGQRN